MIDNTRFCRYCKSYDHLANLIYYAHCSYGHPLCLLEKRGFDWVKTLPTWRLKQIRWEWLEQRNMIEPLKEYLRTMGLTIHRKQHSRVVHVRGLPSKGELRG